MILYLILYLPLKVDGAVVLELLLDLLRVRNQESFK